MAVMAYQTQDGLANYGFSIEFMPDLGWRIFIVFLPSRKGVDELRLPYHAIDRTGRLYVNWSAKIDSLGEAKVVAALWAELTRFEHRARADVPSNAAHAEAPDPAPTLRTDAA